MGTFSPFSLKEGYWSTSVPSSSDFEFTSATGFNITDYVTLECWVYFSSLGSDQLITGRESNFWLGYDHTGVGGASNKLVFTIYNGSSWSAVSSSTTPVTNTWYHIMGVKDGTTLRFYFNGAQENTGTMSGTPNNSAKNFFVGANNGAESMNGYVSNARLVTGASNGIFPYSGLTSGSSFSVPSKPLTSVSGTQILTSSGNRFTDFNTDTTAKTFSNVNGTPKIQPFSPFAPSRSYSKNAVGGSAFFDGTSDGLNAGTSAVFLPIANTDFTFEAWVYLTATPSTEGALIMGISEYGTSSDWILSINNSLIPELYLNATSTAYKGTTAINKNS